MSTDNALLEFEGGQNAFPMTELTDTGDAQLFESGEELWSQAAGFAPVVRPDGVVTGADITPASGNDSVAVAAFTAFVGGVERSEEHTSELQSRPHLVCRLLLEKKNFF